MFRQFTASFASIPRQAPFAFAVAYAGAKTVGADLMVQKWVEQRDRIDKARALVFLGFGFFQVGVIQYAIYCKLYVRIFRGTAEFVTKSWREKLADRRGILNVGKQVFVDQCIYHPLCYFPVFYICQEIVHSRKYDPAQLVPAAMKTYAGNCPDDWYALWKLFVPVSLIQFTMVPLHLRVPWVATCGIVWCAILSFMRGDRPKSAANAGVERIRNEAVARLRLIDAQELSRRLQATAREHCADGFASPGIDREHFARMMQDLGVCDDSPDGLRALDSLFEIFDTAGSGLVNPNRLLADIRGFTGDGTKDERLAFVMAHPEFSREAGEERKTFKPPVHPKTPEMMDRLRQMLLEDATGLFKDLKPAELDVVLLALKERRLEPGEVFVNEGSAADSLYLLERGAAYSKHTIDGREHYVRTLKPGDVFGESALLDYNPRRRFTYVGLTPAVCWTLDRETFAQVVREAAVDRRTKFDLLLKQVNLIEPFDLIHRQHFRDVLCEEFFNKGDVIYREGDPALKFYIVEEGCVHAYIGGEHTIRFGRGEHFGEGALLSDKPRTARLVVESDKARILSMSRQAFHSLNMPSLFEGIVEPAFYKKGLHSVN
eukprot:TRINITY_DN17678_c0_g1_i1.p1 TRINITY_DN17678_c0_g1~~TRINITY_DN17678_c0_g1_i1.p1  ORF type:complete len:602 (-),score=99.77 TRINITY_DN17678_c0_g1_i1:183-1988(-)